MKWLLAAAVAALGVGILAVNAMHRAAPVFKAECHASGGWAYMSSTGHYEGCIYPPPREQ